MKRIKQITSIVLLVVLVVSHLPTIIWADENISYISDIQDVEAIPSEGVPYLGEKNVKVSISSVDIDGISFSKAVFSSAMPTIQSLPNTQATQSINEYSQLLLVSAESAGGLAALGLGISSVFQKIAFKFNLESISSLNGSQNKVPVYKIPSGALEGLNRDISVVFGANSVVIDGIPFGFNWLTFQIAEYVANNINSIQEDTSSNQKDSSDKSEDLLPPNGVGDSVKSNLGNEINTKPSSNHSTSTQNPGYKGPPDSSLDIIDKEGHLRTRRWFDSDGNAIRDVDFTVHGNSSTHPEVPHEHFWEYGPDGIPKRVN